MPSKKLSESAVKNVCRALAFAGLSDGIYKRLEREYLEKYAVAEILGGDASKLDDFNETKFFPEFEAAYEFLFGKKIARSAVEKAGKTSKIEVPLRDFRNTEEKNMEYFNSAMNSLRAEMGPEQFEGLKAAIVEIMLAPDQELSELEGKVGEAVEKESKRRKTAKKA